MRTLRVALPLMLAGATGLAHGQLTVEQALAIARQNNGTVRAAYLSYLSAQAQTRASFAAFLPTVTPTLRQENGRLENHTGLARGGSTIDSTDASIVASWLILDNGTRGNTFRQAQLSRDVAEFTALDTLRTVLFQVHQSFFNALRAQDLLAVQTSSVQRAKEILDRAVLSEEVGAGAKKDILQARADYLNAQVNELAARNLVTTSRSSLWALIGYDGQELPELARPEGADAVGGALPQDVVVQDMGQLVSEALARRADLQANRARTRLAEQRLRAAKLDASFDLSLSAQYNKSFSESVFDRSGLILQASFPLYDGSRSRERVRSAGLDLESSSATLEQASRTATAEVESAYKEFVQNSMRVPAAREALAAAKLNYEAATEARKEGAGELIEELTAQLSLATAESNYIQALYDLLIADVRLRLATGLPMPGEEEPEE
jgi:outer membrane protein